MDNRWERFKVSKKCKLIKDNAHLNASYQNSLFNSHLRGLTPVKIAPKKKKKLKVFVFYGSSVKVNEKSNSDFKIIKDNT